MREAKAEPAIVALLRHHLLYAIAIGLVILSLLLVSLYAFLPPLFSASQPSQRSDDSALTAKESRRLAAELSADFAPLPLNPDELFPPEEPDFLPRVLLSREPRSAWSVEDAEPFWTDPASMDQVALHSEAKQIIDALMETVP